MRIRRSVLARFVEVPREGRALRDLLDDLGLEVKRLDELPGDLGLTLELLANRGDHHCYAGLAREVHGRTGAPIRLPRVAPLEVGEAPVPLRCETDLCPVYTATLLVRDAPGLGTLTEDTLAPVLAADQHPVSAPVDATNLANLELGQPTHAFDADTLEGGITIRLSRPGETCLPLFAEERVELPEGTLIIADDVKVLAIAGVIGCQESRTTEATRRILLESAHFDPVSVRRAARALNLSTDSSARFERGSDPSAPLSGAGRVVHLLTTEAGWRVEGATGQVGDWTDPGRILPLSVPAAAAFLEVPLDGDEVAERLGRYGFTVSPAWPDWDPDQGWSTPPALQDLSRDRLRGFRLVRVPPHRLWDVEDRADLYEELARSIGYNATPAHLPPIALGSLPSVRAARQARITEVLLGHGFYEVVLDGFHGRDLADRLGLPPNHPLMSHVETLNALDRAYSLLKNHALPQALEGVADNLNVRHERVRAFEWTRTFHPDRTAPNGVCRERKVLWAIAVGPDRAPTWAEPSRPVDAWTLKGLVSSMAIEIGLHLEVRALPDGAPVADLLHPGRRAGVYLGDALIGALGEVHPRIVAAFRIKRARPVYLELDADALLETDGGPPAWSMPPASQPIERQLTFTLPPRIAAGEVADTLVHAGPDWLTHVEVVDLYAHDEDGVPVRSVTWTLRFDTEAQARTADEVNALLERLVQAVEGDWGGRGVKLRS
jgi:phenylalanyl-tRNA synthetase beta chain